MSDLPSGVTINGEIKPEFQSILTKDALTFLAAIHRQFESRRQDLLNKRVERQKDIDNGTPLQFAVGDHEENWKVAFVPDEIQCRHVEITGPVNCKMIINALNSGADVFMADFEDSNSPTWDNCMQGQVNLKQANERTIMFTNPDGSVRKLKEKIATLFVRTRGWHLDEKHIEIDNKSTAAAFVDFGLYFFHNIKERLESSVRKLKEKIATLFVRTRGWHLDEKHIEIDNKSTAAAFVDFGLYFFHNIKERLESNSSTYFYLPKMEHHLECRLWNDIFEFAEDYMKVTRGQIRVTVMVETLPAALEMEEMLYELRHYACAMNAGRWDYIFSAIKVLKSKPECVMPDRKQVTMNVPFMKAYAERLVQICHKHGAHAMGGMSAFIPSRRDENVNKIAIEQVTKDKEKEVGEGYDGTWVAHPDLVKLAKDIFMNGLDGKNNQVERLSDDKEISLTDILTIHVDGAKITETGARLDISIALSYLNCWFQGQGAVALFNMMEDAATAEISRAQLWQWLHHQSKFDDGRTFTKELFLQYLDEELEKLGGRSHQCLEKAEKIVRELVLNTEFIDFLTLPGYDCLVNEMGK